MIDSPFSLNGKTILVTGASSGIGWQCAIDCSKMGAKVALVARNEEKLKDTFSEMQGEGHKVYSCDLACADKIPSLVNQVVSDMGRVDGFIHCAGMSMVKPIKLCSTELAQSIYDVNILSSFLLAKELSKVGKYNKDGASFIFIGSVMGCVGESGKALYSMSKGALIAGSKSLAAELGHKRIRVNCVSPGVIVTPINENLPHIADPDQRKVTESKHILGLGKTTDISNACIYLLSDAARWVTGINLIVDGGYTAR